MYHINPKNFTPGELRDKYFREHNLDQALEYAHQAVALCHENCPSYSHFTFFTRGIIFQVKGDFRNAIDDYSRSIQYAIVADSPDSATPITYKYYWGRATCYYRLGETGKAVEDYIESLSNLLSLGGGFAGKGKYDNINLLLGKHSASLYFAPSPFETLNDLKAFLTKNASSVHDQKKLDESIKLLEEISQNGAVVQAIKSGPKTPESDLDSGKIESKTEVENQEPIDVQPES